MSLTGSMQTMAAAGVALLAGGLLIGVHGVIRSDVPRSLGGASLACVGLFLIALAAIRRWICETSDERRDLARARRDADADKNKYFASRAALESEMTRLNRDMNAERRSIAATLITERQAMLADFEEQRLQITTQAFRTGVEMERSGALKPDQPAAPANLIPFPKPQLEHERSRGHEVVGP